MPLVRLDAPDLADRGSVDRQQTVLDNPSRTDRGIPARNEYPDPEYPVLVKRVIGVPGETVSSVGNTILILTGSRWRNRGYRN